MVPDHLRTSLDGPWGPVTIAATWRGILAVHWLPVDRDLEAGLRRRFAGRTSVQADGPGTDPDDAEDLVRPAGVGAREGHLARAVDALARLFDGRPPERLPAVDLADRPAWDRAVLGAVAGVAWGRTSSYGEIARSIGAPRAARAVGGAVGRNPIGLLIPCHRIIAGDGTIGGYGGDAWGSREDRLAIKRALLRREGVTIPEVTTEA